MELEERMDNLLLLAEDIEEKLKKKIKEKEEGVIQKTSEKKNSHLHMLIETSLMKKIQRQSEEQGVSLAEFVRQKLRSNDQLDRIEMKVDKLSNKR